MQTYADGRNANWADTLVATATVPNVTTRASRIENLPDDDVEVFVYLWAWNGTTNPASTTTWTLGFLSVEDVANVPTYLAGVRPQGNNAPLPVVFPTAQAVTPSALVAGTAAIGDVGQQYRANATGAANRFHFVAAASTNATNIKNAAGRLIGFNFINTTAAIVYVKLTNTATAPTAGSTAVHMAIGIPANGTVNGTFEGGVAFATGISFFTVTGAADANATAVGLESIVGSLIFA
jgi:hypothetical protein